MITSIKQFESLSQDRANAAKMDELIRLCNEMIMNTQQSEHFKELKKQENEEIKTTLSEIEETSVIAKGVLVEVIKPYKINKLSTKDYFNFVKNSTDIITDEFREISDEIKNLAVKTKDASSHIRVTKNTRDLEDGIIKNEGLEDLYYKAKRWFKNLFYKLSKTNKILNNIENKAGSFFKLTENVNEELTDEEREARNKYSREYKKKKRDEAKKVARVLKSAKKVIDLQASEQYYKTLANTQKEQIMTLLEQLDAKSVVIGNSIVSVVKTVEKESFDINNYKEMMNDAEKVSANVTKMTNALLKIHENVIEVSGSVRQYHNDNEDLEDGTFGATFDYDNKTVVKNEGIKDWFTGLWKKLRTVFNYFKKSSNKVDEALNNINTLTK